MKVRQRTFYYVLPLLIVGLLFICGRELYAQRSLTSSDVSKPFPAINLPILYHAGKRFTNQEFLGKVSVVNFWASWCAACRQEHSTWLWIQKNEAIPIYGVAFHDEPFDAKTMLKSLGNPYALAINDELGSMELTLGVDVVPQTFVVDAQGKIRYHHVGAITKAIWESEFHPFIEKLKKE